MIDFCLFILLATFWGGSFIAIKNLIADVPSFTSAMYRVFFSLVFLFIIYFKHTKVDFRDLKFIKEFKNSALTGLFSIGIPFAFLFWGEKFVSPSLAAIINGTVPLWTFVIAFFFFDGRKDISLLKVVGLFLGVLGIVIIFYPKIHFSGNASEIFGLIAIVCMAISYALGINFNKTLLGGHTIVNGPRNTIVQQLSSVLFLILLAIIIDGVPDFRKILVPQNFYSIIYLSLFSTTIAFIIFYRLILKLGAVKASTVTFFVPPIALILDSLIYSRNLEFYESIGAVTIFLSMYFLKDKKVIQ